MGTTLRKKKEKPYLKPIVRPAMHTLHHPCFQKKCGVIMCCL